MLWQELLSRKIANAFCLAKSIAKEIVKFEGVIWLASIRRKKFKDTDQVNNKIYGCFVEFDGYSNDNEDVVLPREGKYIVVIQIKYSLY